MDNLIEDMYLSRKPIAAMCNGIVLVAKSLESEANSTEVYADIQNRIVTTPAFIEHKTYMK